MRSPFILTAIAIALAAAPAAAGPTPAQQCAAGKTKATGKYAQCRFSAQAKATKKGTTPDFAKCDSKVAQAFAKLETKYAAACPTIGDLASVQERVATEQAELACLLQGFSDPPSASITIIPDLEVSVASDTVVTVRSLAANFVTTHCFYIGATCVATDFILFLPAFSERSWNPADGDFDNGIPPVPTLPFSGELVCVQVDASDAPLSGNHLVASTTQPGQCRQGGLGVMGGFDNNGDTTLDLGGPSFEYDGCPATLDPGHIESCWSNSPFTFACH